MDFMERSIQITFPYDDDLVETIKEYNSAVNFCMVSGKEHQTYNKNDIHKLTYYEIRDNSDLNSSFVCCARDQASEMLKREKLKTLPIKKELSGIRFNHNTFTMKADGVISISTLEGRKLYTPKIADYFKRYLIKENKAVALTLYCKDDKIFGQLVIKIPDIEKLEVKKVLGIDRGIVNPVVSSNNKFFNSRNTRRVTGKYSWLKKKLQHKGTKSARRKLKKLSGKQKRFVTNQNHIMAKKIVEMDFECYALEKLSIKRKKKVGKTFNKKLNGWSYFEFQKFLEYKSENVGKQVIYVNPAYTSQCCNNCGKIHKANRNGSTYKCKKCGFELNADLNASRNIAELGKAFFSRLSVNEPIVASLVSATSHSL